MNITLLTIGSRGDVQPFVALGVGLKEAGHEVTLATGKRPSRRSSLSTDCATSLWRWTCSNACSRPRAKLPSLARTSSPL